MSQQDWDAKEFVERMVAGDGELVEMLADLLTLSGISVPVG